MCNNAKNSGFTLLGTVFILLILSLVGVYLLKMGSVRTSAQNDDLQHKRAELAAFSALEIAAHKFQENPRECPKQTIQFNEVATGLKGFTVAITCSQLQTFPSKSPLYFSVQLDAKAFSGNFGERDFVSYSMNRLIFIEQ
jgi:hypothetical protein